MKDLKALVYYLLVLLVLLFYVVPCLIWADIEYEWGVLTGKRERRPDDDGDWYP